MKTNSLQSHPVSVSTMLQELILIIFSLFCLKTIPFHHAFCMIRASRRVRKSQWRSPMTGALVRAVQCAICWKRIIP